MVVCRTEGQLAAHLRHEHHQTDDQAEREAHEAATGIRRDADGRCVACKAPEGHHGWCPAVKRAAKYGYPPETPALTAAAPAALSQITTTGHPTPTTPAPEETPMRRKIDPAACRVCARLTKKAGTPTKCKRHGGAGHPKTASNVIPGGKQSKPVRQRAGGRTSWVGSKAEKLLTAEKARVTALREQLRNAEVRVEVLTELQGA
jgi:hypothetical protein